MSIITDMRKAAKDLEDTLNKYADLLTGDDIMEATIKYIDTTTIDKISGVFIINIHIKSKQTIYPYP